MAQKATSEDSGYSAQEIFAQNKSFLAPGEHKYNTDLGSQEPAFREWVNTNKVAFDPTDQTPDYDMRGFWKALQAKDPKAMSAVDPNDQQMHYPDYWKTPYDRTFSVESQWANPQTAPRWNDKDQLVTPDGKVLYDDKKAGLLQLLHKVLSNKQLMQSLGNHIRQRVQNVAQ